MTKAILQKTTKFKKNKNKNNIYQRVSVVTERKIVTTPSQEDKALILDLKLGISSFAAIVLGWDATSLSPSFFNWITSKPD